MSTKSEPISLDDLVNLVNDELMYWGGPRTPIDEDTPLAVYDFDSLDTVAIQTTIEDKIGRELPSDTVVPELTCRQLHEEIRKAVG